MSDHTPKSPSENPLLKTLARHGITDPHAFLDKHENAPLDTTPRIEGAPVRESVKDAEEKAKRLRFL